MKTLGLIGGMTWHTTAMYYAQLNEKIAEQLGSNHSLKCLLYSFDFQEIEVLQNKHKWGQLSKEIIFQANNLRNAGADVLVLCSNTIHKVAPEIRKNTNLKLIHIVETVGESLVDRDVIKVLLLGTRYTMLDNFYQDILKQYGVEVVIPNLEWVNKVHNIIFQELANGEVNDDSKMKLIALIESFALSGVTGVVLGCTELGMLLKEEDVSVHVFDTMMLHIEKIITEII